MRASFLGKLAHSQQHCGAKKFIQVFIHLNLYTALIGKDRERFMMKKASTLPMVTETEERREDQETSASDGWSPEGFMTTAVCEERGGQIETLVSEYLTVRFS